MSLTQLPTVKSMRSDAVGLLNTTALFYEDVDVAIVCESTYPYLTGGLSAVVHQICEANPNRTIGIIHITWDENSPSEPLYDVPGCVRWVMPVYQSMSSNHEQFQALTVKDMGVGRKARQTIARQVVRALKDHGRGDDSGLWTLYDQGVNPLTRSYLLWPILGSEEFLDETSHFDVLGLPLAKLFWSLREFFSLAFAVSHQVFPRAAVYHAHTTGAASLLSAVAARQRGTRFLLTEHNLYTRDTVNTLLRRSMAEVVAASDWLELGEYASVGDVREMLRATGDQRAWMAWFIGVGAVVYRSADRVTYLYPEAIEEARALGGIPEKSMVLANGIELSAFDAARQRFQERRARAQDEDGPHIWRLGFAARVVQIKGVSEVIDAAALLVSRGITNFELDIMGPDQEDPAYAAGCRERAHRLGLDGYVKFCGSVSLRKVFGEYDMLVMGSYNEGQPVVVYEAMTVGLPVIGTAVGGMQALVSTPMTAVDVRGREVVVGPAGLLVGPGDPEGLADILEQAMTDEALFESMSRNGQERVERFFQLAQVMDNYSNVYSQLGAPPRGALEATVSSIERQSSTPTTATDGSLADGILSPLPSAPATVASELAAVEEQLSA